jgi:hypothetical protein
MTSLGFTKSKVDSNLYFKVMNDEPVIFLLYVDDLFLTGEGKIITKCKKKIASEFEMKDLLFGRHVLYSLHVCVWAVLDGRIRQLHLTIPLVVLFVSCAPGAFLGGSQGGQVCPPGYAQRSGSTPFFFGAFFAIFSGFLN